MKHVVVVMICGGRGPVRQESTAREESSGGIYVAGGLGSSCYGCNGWFEEHGLVGCPAVREAGWFAGLS
ncbi:hypothetical protein M0R45_001095 [Rubus argutus]|uniref:Uncharacterized protein n=1 Tax=Rubus argutus TaxID=59490 RepID=A0AAW1VIZ0_RUBAR